MLSPAVSAPRVEPFGRIFNLQRCSVHDGPGIRTTVFFKGCPLSCAWCHNPEGIDPRPELMLDGERCVSCRICSEVCSVSDGAVPAAEGVRPPGCTRCGSCVDACPADARTLAGREIAANELVELVVRDRPFFEASGGGVTFSGGEPLSQPDFLAGCLHTCRELGLHTAVDTCGVAPRDALLEMADLCDLVLYDVKHMDPDAHRRYTGADNRRILENLRALSETDIEIWIRAPLIPGVNDDDTHLDSLGKFLASLHRRHRVFLLPYHAIAEGKTARLGGSPSFTPFAVPDAGRLAAARHRLRSFGLTVAVGGSS